MNACISGEGYAIASICSSIHLSTPSFEVLNQQDLEFCMHMGHAYSSQGIENLKVEVIGQELGLGKCSQYGLN